MFADKPIPPRSVKKNELSGVKEVVPHKGIVPILTETKLWFAKNRGIFIPETTPHIEVVSYSTRDSIENNTLSRLGIPIEKDFPAQQHDYLKQSQAQLLDPLIARIIGLQQSYNHKVDSFNAVMKMRGKLPILLINGHGGVSYNKIEDKVWVIGNEDDNLDLPVELERVLENFDLKRYSAVMIGACNFDSFQVFSPGTPIFYGDLELSGMNAITEKTKPRLAWSYPQSSKALVFPTGQYPSGFDNTNLLVPIPEVTT